MIAVKLTPSSKNPGGDALAPVAFIKTGIPVETIACVQRVRIRRFTSDCHDILKYMFELSLRRTLVLPDAGTETFFLWGPRQVGKTTLLRQTYPNALWVDL